MKKNIILPYEKTASFDVDCQKGFTELCPYELPVPNALTIVPELNKQATFAKYRVGSKDWHNSNAIWIATIEHPQFTQIIAKNMDCHWNKHCIAGTVGADLIEGLPKEIDYDFMVYKGLEKNIHPYGACYHDLQETKSTGVIDWLLIRKIENIIIGGLALDYCVAITALQLNRYFNVFVNLKATVGINSNSIYTAKENMKKAGIKLLDDLSNIQH